MDLDDIRENYAKFDNEKLIKLATEEIKSLRKEVIPILVAELAKRNISITKKKTKKGLMIIYISMMLRIMQRSVKYREEHNLMDNQKIRNF